MFITVVDQDYIQDWDKNDPNYGPYYQDAYGDSHKTVTIAPYQPGQKVYLRESYAEMYDTLCLGVPDYSHRKLEDDTYLIWRSSAPDDYIWTDEDGGFTDKSYWKSAAVMPKKYAQVWLEITGVRVKRVGEITRTEIRALGFVPPKELRSDDVAPNYRDWYPKAFKELWTEKHGKFDPNQWVFIHEFRRLNKHETKT
jgi:hypothetical protein